MEKQPLQLVSLVIYNPAATSLFRTKANDRAEARSIYCSCPSCPLLAVGQCVMTKMFPDACPHGELQREVGPTKRAAGLSRWVAERKAKLDRRLTDPPVRMAIVGEYVYLPYPHMALNERVGFVRKSMPFLGGGVPFVPLERFTIETVLAIVRFRPQAMFGGEIRAYQAESVPLFVQHLREQFPALWGELVKHHPEFDKTPNYVGRKARLLSLKGPFTFEARPGETRYPVIWRWDGETLQTTSQHAIQSTWPGDLKGDYLVTLRPTPETVITVQSNDWVTSDTIFID